MKSDSLFTRYICSDEDSNPGAHTQNNLWSSLAMANFTKSHCEMMKQQYVKFKKISVSNFLIKNNYVEL